MATRSIMSRIIYCIALATVLGTVTTLHANGSKQSPIDEFRKATQFQLMGCQMAVINDNLRDMVDGERQPFARIGLCIKDGKEKIEKLVPNAMAYLAAKPAAMNLFQEYYTAWMTLLNGVMPGFSEPGSAYQQRQRYEARQADEAWQRLASALSTL